MTRRRRHQSLIPLSHQHRDALMVAFRLHHPAPPGPVTAMTPASTPQSRAADALAFFRDHLVGHFRAEEDVLFPALRARLAADAPRTALIDGLVAEHRRLEALRDGVAAAGEDETALAPALTAFADLLEAHVRCEERELFEVVPDVLAAGDTEALEAAIRTALGTRPAA
jgi:hemerythrin-like domain-containing protein